MLDTFFRQAVSDNKGRDANIYVMNITLTLIIDVALFHIALGELRLMEPPQLYVYASFPEGLPKRIQNPI